MALRSVVEIVNLTENLDCFDLESAHNERSYGAYRLEWDWDLCGMALERFEKSEDPADHKLFEWRFVAMLLPVLEFGSVIILDNASFNRKTILRTVAEKESFSIVFLPPYSPDCNPIEHF